MKRGIRVFMHEPLPDGKDPYVDMVVALTRRTGDGLWIPNLKARRWDASHPEKHFELMTAGSRGLRRTRAHVVRLAKAVEQAIPVPALSSFNLCTLGLKAITSPMPIEQAWCAYSVVPRQYYKERKQSVRERQSPSVTARRSVSPRSPSSRVARR